MRYFTDEENVIWSKNALKDYYKHIIETKEIDSETFPTFEDWLDEVLNRACTFEEMKVSDYDRLDVSTEPIINIAMIDSKELPAMLDALIKQELYKWFGKFDNPEEHVKAEITRIESKKACLKDLLKAYQAMIPIGTKLDNAVNESEDMENEGKIQQLYIDYEKKMIEAGELIIDVVGEIIPKNIDLCCVYTEWFESTDDSNDNYIEALIAWCDTPIILEAYEHLF